MEAMGEVEMKDVDATGKSKKRRVEGDAGGI